MKRADDPRYRRPDDYEAARAHWRALPRARPAQIKAPGPGQESVWDYPRPPRLDLRTERVEVRAGAVIVASTDRAARVCETSSPPVYYVPSGDVDSRFLVATTRESFCEWKGLARYWHVKAGDTRFAFAAWSYADPSPGFEPLRDAVAFYPGRVSCSVDAEPVRAQPGDFYGGWVTDRIVGPFKGEPGTEDW